MKPKIEVYNFEGPGYSIGVYGMAEGTLKLSDDDRLMMVDDLGNEMPLGKFLRSFTKGSQPTRITVDNLHYAPGSVNKKKVLYP